ncbi:MAG: carbonic anhydrase [Rhodothermales bacterium]
MIPANEALKRLREGNLRYLSDKSNRIDASGEERRKALVAGQSPYAIILGCSDSRVPVETIFDEGLGELFAIRVAGNVAGPIQVGSIEYAVDVLDTQLIVVLGHTGCGAVQATLDEMKQPSDNLTPGIQSIVSEISRALSASGDSRAGIEAYQDIDDAVRVNAAHSAMQITRQSELIEQRLKKGTLQIVHAMYSLKSGEVTFF